MQALCWTGVNKLSVERVPDPEILQPKDAIVKVLLSSVCGSDLHLLHGYVPTMKEGDIIGHEFIGEIVEVGPDVTKFKRGDRVIVISVIGCGTCPYCSQGMWSLCDNSNPHPEFLEPVMGHTTAGIFGYSHAFGGYAGSHAQFIRVPFADHGCFKVPEEISDTQALFVSDAAPTGYMGADLCGIEPGDTVAVWGCGGVGQMAIRAACIFGAEKVIAIDRVHDRLRMAAEKGGALIVDYSKEDVHERLLELTGGRGPDRCIDAVGMEAEGGGLENLYDRAKQAVMLQTDRGEVLRQAIRSCRKGGTISVMGVYGGVLDKFPIGVVMNKGLSLRAGQQHGQKYAPRIFEDIKRGKLDTSYLLTHCLSLEDGPRGYEIFANKEKECMRAVFAPNGEQIIH